MLTKRSASLNFAQGLDTKTDPKQVLFGKFLSLVNSVFTKSSLLMKRYGYGSLVTSAGSTYLTTFNGNLTAIGNSLNAYSESSASFVDKGSFQSISLNVMTLARSAFNQTQCDAVIAPNKLICTVYTEVDGGVASYKYVIADSVTGQNIISPTVIPVASGTVTGSPRVFLLSNYFIVVFTNVISSTAHLQYIAISVNNPSIVTTNADIASAYISATTLSWDGIVFGDILYIAYNATAGGQHVNITYLNSSLVVASPTTFAGSVATIMSMTVDSSSSSLIIYAAFWDSASSTGYAVAVDMALNKRMSATEWLSSGSVDNVTCTAQNGVLTIVYENANTYGYDNTITTNFLANNTITLPATVTTGTLGSAATFLRSVGLASKGCLVNGTMYVLATYASALQDTYFLTDISGNIISRFAYENGGGYLTVGLPQAQVIGSTITCAYLFKDLIETTNTEVSFQSIGVPNLRNIYTQTGVNLISLDFTSSIIDSSEIGNNLNLTGGMLWAYDGAALTEQGFHIFPDNIETTYTETSTVTPTGTASNGSTTITLSSGSGVSAGMSIADSTNSTYIPTGTIILSISGTTAVMSAATTHAISGDTLSIQGNIAAKPDGSTNTDAYYYQVIYQWTDLQGNVIQSAPSVPVPVTTAGSGTAGSIAIDVPTLRLTYKTNVKILIYRWSVASQVYYQVTSLTSPTLNNKAVDYITFVDNLPDSSVVGNSTLYTTGGVLEDIAGPAAIATTLFDDRLWLIDAEDQNLLWYSKQIIESTTVEMSDLLTIYVAPSTGSQGSTGPLKCIFPMDDKIILFKANAAYYINGTGPDNTGANSTYSQPIFITSSVGCANQKSIVLIPTGLMFQSDKGIWLLGRDLSTTYIGAPVEAFNSYTVTSALTIPATTQVLFTLSNGTILMYDYFYEQWGTFVGAPGISATLYNNLHTIINSTGLVSQQTPGLYLDNDNPVLLGFTTSWLNLTGLQGYQRAYFFYLLGQYLTPHKIQVGIAYDYNSTFYTAPIIYPTNYTPNYGTISPYGQDLYGSQTITGSIGQADIEQWRVFFKKQRCQAFQITLQESYDSTFGVPAGAGFTLSGLNLIYGSKQGFRPIPATQSVG